MVSSIDNIRDFICRIQNKEQSDVNEEELPKPDFENLSDIEEIVSKGLTSLKLKNRIIDTLTECDVSSKY